MNHRKRPERLALLIFFIFGQNKIPLWAITSLHPCNIYKGDREKDKYVHYVRRIVSCGEHTCHLRFLWATEYESLLSTDSSSFY